MYKNNYSRSISIRNNKLTFTEIVHIPENLIDFTKMTFQGILQTTAIGMTQIIDLEITLITIGTTKIMM